MKVGIIGGSSFLGSHLIRSFAKIPKISFYIWSRNKHTNLAPQSTYFKYDYPKTKINVTDLLCCDAIFYCAGVGVQPNKSFTTKELYQLNLYEPINLINRLQQNDYKGNVILFGSYFEIGINNKNAGYNEAQLIVNENKPFNEYAITKKLLTSFINQKLSTNTSLNISHFILPNIYGENEDRNRLIPYLVKQILTKQSIKLGKGTQIRQYLYIGDVIIFFKNLLLKNKKLNGIYNLGGAEKTTVKNIVQLTVNYLNQAKINMVDVNYNEVQKKDASADSLSLDDTKARAELGWLPNTKLRDVIPKYFDKISG